MESYLSYVGLAGSALSTLTTLYFWLVRMRRERPSLRPYLVDNEFFLGIGRDDVRQIGLKIGVIVANDSVLPNAILDARLWARVRDGWEEVGRLAFDKQTPQPCNIPPLQTVLLRLTGTLSFRYQDELEKGSETLRNYLNSLLAQPRELKLELRHMNEQIGAHVMSVPADGVKSAQGLSVISSAA
jgi:hypothetical protein